MVNEARYLHAEVPWNFAVQFTYKLWRKKHTDCPVMYNCNFFLHGRSAGECNTPGADYKLTTDMLIKGQFVECVFHWRHFLGAASRCMASSNQDCKVHISLSHVIEIKGLLNHLDWIVSMNNSFVETRTLSVASRHSKNNAQLLNPACQNQKAWSPCNVVTRIHNSTKNASEHEVTSLFVFIRPLSITSRLCADANLITAACTKNNLKVPILKHSMKTRCSVWHTVAFVRKCLFLWTVCITIFWPKFSEHDWQTPANEMRNKFERLKFQNCQRNCPEATIGGSEVAAGSQIHKKKTQTVFSMRMDRHIATLGQFMFCNSTRHETHDMALFFWQRNCFLMLQPKRLHRFANHRIGQF